MKINSYIVAMPIAFILLLGCKNKMNNSLVDTQVIRNQEMTDSMLLVYADKTVYTFSESCIVYADSMLHQIADTVGIAHPFFVPSKFILFKEQVRSHGEMLYVKNGMIKKGFVEPYTATSAFSISKKDSATIYLANYVAMDTTQHRVVLKYILKGKVVDEISLDTPYTNINWMELSVIDSATLEGTNDLISLSSYYPACGYGTKEFYLNASKGKLQFIINTFSWADAPNYTNTYIYFPSSYYGSKELYRFTYSQVTKDTAGVPLSYTVPNDVKVTLNQLIYIENHESRDSLKKGKPVLDEYEEVLYRDFIDEARLYQWTGTQLKLLKATKNNDHN